MKKLPRQTGRENRNTMNSERKRKEKEKGKMSQLPSKDYGKYSVKKSIEILNILFAKTRNGLMSMKQHDIVF